MATMPGTLAFLVVLFGIFGAKVLYIINAGASTRNHTGVRFQSQHAAGGRRILGGLIAALLTAAWYMRPSSHAGGCARPTASLRAGLLATFSDASVAFRRAGCYGKPTSHFWGVRLHESVGAFRQWNSARRQD